MWRQRQMSDSKLKRWPAEISWSGRSGHIWADSCIRELAACGEGDHWRKSRFKYNFDQLSSMISKEKHWWMEVTWRSHWEQTVSSLCLIVLTCGVTVHWWDFKGKTVPIEICWSKRNNRDEVTRTTGYIWADICISVLVGWVTDLRTMDECNVSSRLCTRLCVHVWIDVGEFKGKHRPLEISWSKGEQ